MEEVRAWKADDGKLFESQQAANLHDLYLKFKDWYEAGDGVEYSDAEGMYDYLYDNYRALLPLLEAFQDCNNAMPIEYKSAYNRGE